MTRSIRVPVGLGASSHSIFLALLKQEGLPIPVPEHRFSLARRWRFDYGFCLPGAVGRALVVAGRELPLVALEIEGGAHVRGRHTRGTGFLKDCEKYSEAAALGWRIVRVPPSDLCTIRTIDWIRRALTL